MGIRTYTGKMLLCGLLLVTCSAFLRAEEIEPVRRQLHWWEFLRAEKPTAREQLQYANELKDAGHLRKARGQYRALVFAWPYVSEAAIAQLSYADLLYQRGKVMDAFNEYQYLVETYEGMFSYAEVLNRQYSIADTVATRERRFLFFTYSTVEESIPLFAQLIQNGMHWKLAGEAQFRIARIYEKGKQYNLAIEAYQKYQQMYSLGPLAEQANLGYARCCYLLSGKNPNDSELQEHAIMALQSFMALYPRNESIEFIKDNLRELKDKRAHGLYRQARMYEHSVSDASGKEREKVRLTAALMVYQRLMDEYPRSSLDGQAQSRVARIKKELEGLHEK